MEQRPTTQEQQQAEEEARGATSRQSPEVWGEDWGRPGTYLGRNDSEIGEFDPAGITKFDQGKESLTARAEALRDQVQGQGQESERNSEQGMGL